MGNIIETGAGGNTQNLAGRNANPQVLAALDANSNNQQPQVQQVQTQTLQPAPLVLGPPAMTNGEVLQQQAQQQQQQTQQPEQGALQLDQYGNVKPEHVSGIVAKEVAKALSRVYADLGVAEGDVKAGKAIIDQFKSTNGATNMTDQNQTQASNAAAAPAVDPQVEALKAEMTALKNETVMSGSGVLPNFKAFVTSEVSAMDGGVTAENVAAYKQSNPQFFATDQKTVRVSSSPSLQGNGVATNPNEHFNEWFRGGGKGTL